MLSFRPFGAMLPGAAREAPQPLARVEGRVLSEGQLNGCGSGAYGCFHKLGVVVHFLRVQII